MMPVSGQVRRSEGAWRGPERGRRLANFPAGLRFPQLGVGHRGLCLLCLLLCPLNFLWGDTLSGARAPIRGVSCSCPRAPPSRAVRKPIGAGGLGRGGVPAGGWGAVDGLPRRPGLLEKGVPGGVGVVPPLRRGHLLVASEKQTLLLLCCLRGWAATKWTHLRSQIRVPAVARLAPSAPRQGVLNLHRFLELDIEVRWFGIPGPGGFEEFERVNSITHPMLA